MRYAMIMAGGAGTRLWPLSRFSRPKQLLPFILRPGEDEPQSLVSLAAGRLDGLVDLERRYICTGESYRGAIREALPDLSDTQILGEPTGRDTVNAVGFTAAVLEKLDPDAVFAVLTADHIIEPSEAFRKLMDVGYRLVEQDPSRLVTFSIKPTYAATGFGYVERGRELADLPDADGLAYRVARFVEKPDEHRAQAYLASGHHGWNSGMFVWKASTVMECLRRFKPESHEGLLKIQNAWGTPDQQRVLNEIYPTLPRTSVDYALMEPASQVPPHDDSVSVCTVLMDLTWLDVGSWPSYAETLEADSDGNRVVDLANDGNAGSSVAMESTDNLIVNSGSGHTITLLGCNDLIVVRTDDATLIMPASESERLKALHAAVPETLK